MVKLGCGLLEGILAILEGTSFNKHPRHIVLDYSQVKEIYERRNEKTGTHSSPLPHERRGHWRQLKSDRFKEKKTVWVRPADINKGLSFTRGNRVYEVVR